MEYIDSKEDENIVGHQVYYVQNNDNDNTKNYNTETNNKITNNKTHGSDMHDHIITNIDDEPTKFDNTRKDNTEGEDDDEKVNDDNDDDKNDNDNDYNDGEDKYVNNNFDEIRINVGNKVDKDNGNVMNSKERNNCYDCDQNIDHCDNCDECVHSHHSSNARGRAISDERDSKTNANNNASGYSSDGTHKQKHR